MLPQAKLAELWNVVKAKAGSPSAEQALDDLIGVLESRDHFYSEDDSETVIKRAAVVAVVGALRFLVDHMAGDGKPASSLSPEVERVFNVLGFYRRDGEVRCSSCGKTRDQVKSMVVVGDKPPHPVCLCYECVGVFWAARGVPLEEGKKPRTGEVGLRLVKKRAGREPGRDK